MPRTYPHPRETVFDLYTERDKLSWYWRTGATISAWIVLAGYILFAVAASSPQQNLKTTTNTLTTVGGVLLIVGDAVCILAASFSRSILFTFDCILLPLLTTSAMGIVVTVVNHALHKTLPVSTFAHIYVPLIIAIISFLLTGAMALISYRRIHKIKETDQRRRSRVSRESNSWGGDASSTHRLLPMEVPEDEAQRRQLLRLLLAREHRSKSPDTQSTYRIDLPSDADYPYNSQNLAVPPSTSRPRGRSLPPEQNQNKWSLSNVLGRRGASPHANPSSDVLFKDPRERRREEIERSSLVMSPPRWDLQQQVPQNDWGWQQSASQQPAWTGQGMSRYA